MILPTVNEIRTKEEVAFQHLRDARDWLKIFELVIHFNRSETTINGSLVAKATVHLAFAIECSLKSMIASKSIGTNETYQQLRNRLKRDGHDIKKLATQLSAELQEADLMSSIEELPFDVNWRYALDSLEDLLQRDEPLQLQWNHYWKCASELLRLAEMTWQPHGERVRSDNNIISELPPILE